MTILGLYSVAELKDLIAAKDTELQTLANAVAQFDAQWKTSDPTTEATWQVDYQALLSRYDTARADAESKISTESEFNPLPNADISANSEYEAVLTSLQQTSGVVSRGDFQDLWDRINDAINASSLQSTNPLQHGLAVPQPSKGSDTDLATYQKADAITRAISVPAGDAGGGSPGWLLTAGIIGVAVFIIDKLVRGGSTVVIREHAK